MKHWIVLALVPFILWSSGTACLTEIRLYQQSGGMPSLIAAILHGGGGLLVGSALLVEGLWLRKREKWSRPV